MSTLVQRSLPDVLGNEFRLVCGWQFMKETSLRASEWQQACGRLLVVHDRTPLLLRLVDELFDNPIISIPKASKVLGISAPAATNNIRKLVDAHILYEVAGHRHPRLFMASGIFEATDEAMESPVE